MITNLRCELHRESFTGRGGLGAVCFRSAKFITLVFLQVKKIFENERRLHAGDHSVELLAQDFEKNYNMYIYPVHWQFAQLDQHPSDR